MVNSTKKALEQINEVSRQLLSRILFVQNSIQEHKKVQAEPATNEQITDHELTKLMSKRQSLINCLFKQNTREEISLEINLLNEMVSLDSELSNKSQACKQALAEQVIKLKKSKKVKKSYQKY
ncbi:MAG: hypothetical protein GY951_18345 [Psychromonas sp.]|nr:hypothetical protein [Psychromonas sp.]